MATKKIPENFQLKEAPCESYASKVFKESSVGFVSSVASLTSIKRRVFKVTAFLLCLTGFLYQSGKFLEGFLMYPTSVDIDIVRPDRYNVPAYTFCDNNVINRRMFCETYKDFCEKSNETFGEKYPFYRGDGETLVPKKEYYKIAADFDMEDMIDLNVNKSKFILPDRNGKSYSPEEISGPFWRISDLDQPGFLCYSLNDRVDNSLPPKDTEKNELMNNLTKEELEVMLREKLIDIENGQKLYVRLPIDVIRFAVRPEETFFPESPAGILFSIHSQFQAVHPFETGIFMKPGRTYMVFVSMEEEVLLKEPYDTNCINYTEKWEKNGKSGPRQQDMCKQECFAEVSMACFDCVVPIFRFPTKHRYCTKADISGENCENVENLLEECNLKCRDDCRRTKYSFIAHERFPFMELTKEEKEDNLTLKNIIRVEIYLEEDELIVLKHSPKYMVVEVFSNIGGFIGIFLGINLLDIAEIFENLFRIIRYSLKRR